MIRSLFHAALLTLLVGPTLAAAQGLTDLDGDGKAKKAKKAKNAAGSDSEVIREVNRGYFLKSNIGSAMYLGTRSAVIKPGTSLALSVGSDFVDRERMSMAWELVFGQGLHNGAKFEEQAGLPPNQLIQGDIHTFSVLGMYEISTYVTRRVGIGARVGGGVMVVPLLIYPDSYQNIVIQQYWNGNQPAVHKGPLPVFGGGPTIEYYTKLSHFSVGVDADFFYAVGLDLGMDYSGYLKYTF